MLEETKKPPLKNSGLKKKLVNGCKLTCITKVNK